MQHILPKVYSSGIFKLKSPLDTLLSDISYTCIAVRKIEEVEALGEDCFGSYYKPLSLSEDDYKRDSKEDVCIITLKDYSGQLKHFPSSYLREFPSSSGIPYSVIGLVFDLGALPVEFSLDTLIVSLQDEIRASIGIDSRYRILTLSNTEIIDNPVHDKIEALRKTKISGSENYREQVKTLKKENKLLREKIAHLEKYILDYQEAIRATSVVIKADGFTP